MKTAVFGGTFNPIHSGHVKMIECVLNNKLADKVLVIPTNIPPHKKSLQLSDAQHRINMCKLATEDIKQVTVSDIEITRGDKSYTIDTLISLKDKYSDLYLVCGGDMIKTFSTWYKYTEILKISSIIAFRRCGVNDREFEKGVQDIINAGGRIYICDADIPNISSTAVRKSITDGENVGGILPDKVKNYIKENNLYNDMYDFENYKQIIKPMLSEKRYIHSLAVADEAKRLAEKYGADIDKAYLAGLLHDIMKTSPDDMQLKIIDKFGIILSDIEKGSKKLWHAISGAAYVENVLNIKDKEIIDAIRYHTTARANMTKLDKVLYLADFTSADRDYDDVDVMRRLVDESDKAALKYALEYTINDLRSKSAAIHPDTLKAFEQINNER